MDTQKEQIKITTPTIQQTQTTDKNYGVKFYILVVSLMVLSASISAYTTLCVYTLKTEQQNVRAYTNVVMELQELKKNTLKNIKNEKLTNYLDTLQVFSFTKDNISTVKNAKDTLKKLFIDDETKPIEYTEAILLILEKLTTLQNIASRGENNNFFKVNSFYSSFIKNNFL